MGKAIALPILGAVIGSIPGLILWVVVGYFGYVLAFLGLVIAAGIFFGYEKFGGTIRSLPGIITCIIVMLITVYLGAHIIWAMQLNSGLKDIGMETSFSFCMTHLYDFLEITETKGDFVGDLLLNYLFAAIGAFGFIRRALRS